MIHYSMKGNAIDTRFVKIVQVAHKKYTIYTLRG